MTVYQCKNDFAIIYIKTPKRDRFETQLSQLASSGEIKSKSLFFSKLAPPYIGNQKKGVMAVFRFVSAALAEAYTLPQAVQPAVLSGRTQRPSKVLLSTTEEGL